MIKIWLCILLTYANGDLLDKISSFEPADQNCYLIKNKQISEIRIEPKQLLIELHAMKKEKEQVIRELRKIQSPDNLGGTLEIMTLNMLNQQPDMIDNMISKQQKLINILSQGVYYTSEIPFTITDDEKANILHPIPALNNEFSADPVFDREFVKMQSLELDSKIKDIMIKLPNDYIQKILSQNHDNMQIQFETSFFKDMPKNIRIGFTEGTTPKHFEEYYKNIVNKDEWRQLLTLISYIKSNILFQFHQKVNPNIQRNSEWFNTISKQASAKQTQIYRYKAAEANNITITPYIRKKRHPVVALAGKAVLGIFAGQAQKMITREIKKLITNKKLEKQQEKMTIPRMHTNFNNNLTELIKNTMQYPNKIQRTYEIQAHPDKDYYRYWEKQTILANHKAQLALKNTLIFKEGLDFFFKYTHKTQYLKDIQNLQFEYAQSVFYKKLPLDLVESLQGTPIPDCKISVTLKKETFTIRYEYHKDITQIATFKINTAPFMIKDTPFTIKLPKEIAILEDGKYTIVNPRIACGPKCLCTENTIKQKIDTCLEQILTDKYTTTATFDIEKCSNYITPTTNRQKAIRYKQDYFSVFTPTKTQAEITCGRNKDHMSLNKGLNRVEVPYGCKLQTNAIQLTNKHIPTEIRPTIHDINLDEEKSKISHKSLTKALSQFNYTTNNEIETNIIKNQASLKERILKLEKSNEQTTIYATTIILSSIIAATIISIVCCMKPMIIGKITKNLMICGCCCGIKPNEHNALTLQENTEKQHIEEQENFIERNKMYPDFAKSELSLSPDEKKQLQGPNSPPPQVSPAM